MSEDIVIKVEHVSKRYLLNQRRSGDGLRHVLQDRLGAPWRALKEQLKRETLKTETGSISASQHLNITASSELEEFWALKDVSFEVKRGEVVGIIGRNGAGKSTLLKILSRITEPTSGQIEIDGRVASLLEVGTGFHPELTGRENIFLNGAILGMKRAEIRAKFGEIVAFAEVEKFLDTPVKRYSSGMYVRLAFAVAAHLEPEILIVDEVLAVGDASFQKRCLGKMRDVSSKEGRTVLFVSHNMAAITQLCRRGVWLQHGRVRNSGDAESVTRAYLSGNSQGVAERRWSYPGNAPGDDRIRLLAGRILQDGMSSDVVDINRDCQLEMEIQVLRPVKNLLTGIQLSDINGTCILNCDDWRENSLDSGVYRKRVTIPAQTLAEGKTSVLFRAIFYDPAVMSAIVPDALTFEAIESDHPLAVRGLYKEYWPGVVRLRLPWGNAVPRE